MEQIVTNKIEIETERTCKVCGRTLPIGQFYRIKKHNSRLGHCKECEKQRREAYLKAKCEGFPDVDITIHRRYKDIIPKRVLDTSDLDLIPLGLDEIFVKLMDYKDAWLSNYGRVIKYEDGRYALLKGGYDADGRLCYTLMKNVYLDGQWTYRGVNVYADQAVVDGFITNLDKVNNIYIWHKADDKKNCYFKDLYPLNQKQYKIVKEHFEETGSDTEEFILEVMNDIRFKPEDWSRRKMRLTLCGVGYLGTEHVDCKSEAYVKWSDMIYRCYYEKFLEKQPQYRGCTVCEEWRNFSNFKKWYDENKHGDTPLDMDKDILSKGNKVYSPETVVLVPHLINSFFVNCKKRRGDFPVGVYYDKDRNKYRAEMSIIVKRKKLGYFSTPQEAFYKYKEYKEKFIKDIAERYKSKIPDKAYRAMLNWEIEIDD